MLFNIRCSIQPLWPTSKEFSANFPGNKHSFLFSISLINLSTSISWNSSISNAQLSTTNVRGGVTAQISGWGAVTQSGTATSFFLSRITTTTISNEECRSRHNEINAKRIVDTKICTFTQSAQGTCTGDEGGALMFGNQLIGVLSWQVPCAIGYPDVYERVADKIPWIVSYINRT